MSYLTAENMHHLAGYILPGLIFSALGLRWALQLLWEWNREMLQGIYESAGLPATPSKQGENYYYLKKKHQTWHSRSISSTVGSMTILVTLPFAFLLPW